MDVYESLMLEIVSRLQTAAVITDLANIRRDHATVVTRDQCPRVHVRDGDETPDPTTRECFRKWKSKVTVSIFVRDDQGFAAVAPIKQAVLAALNPDTTPYTGSAEPCLERISKEQEIADADALRVDLQFELRYQTALWALSAP